MMKAKRCNAGQVVDGYLEARFFPLDFQTGNNRTDTALRGGLSADVEPGDFSQRLEPIDDRAGSIGRHIGHDGRDQLPALLLFQVGIDHSALGLVDRGKGGGAGFFDIVGFNAGVDIFSFKCRRGAAGIAFHDVDGQRGESHLAADVADFSFEDFDFFTPYA